MWRVLRDVLVVLILQIYLSYAIQILQQEETLPKSYVDCVDFIGQTNLPKPYLQTIQRHCLDNFMSLDHKIKWTVNFTDDEQNYIKSIFRKVIADTTEPTNIKRRVKREASLFHRRVRHEVRAEPYSQWQDYARNVRRLKFDKITPTGRNKYDIIAEIHRTAVINAHFGPNFLPWHRLYLVVFEAAIGVPIPYWDSTMDFEMIDPTQSILWTQKYFGNGFGIVKVGPFANFQTPLGPLFRNIGSDGALMNITGVKMILMQSRLEDISQPTAVEGASLELQHNGVHIWVDGIMNNLQRSSHDPIFFCHHAFVDYVWELFRIQQIIRGVDPSKDSVNPPSTVQLQNITDPAVGLTGFYNADGLSHMVAKLLKFNSHPQCPTCGKSFDLFCDERKGVCVSRRSDPRRYEGNRAEAMAVASNNGMMNNGPNAQTFALYSRDMRVRMDSLTMNYGINRRDNVRMNEVFSPMNREIIIGRSNDHTMNNRELFEPRVSDNSPILHVGSNHRNVRFPFSFNLQPIKTSFGDDFYRS